LLANTGIRRAEAMNLKWSNVNEDRIHILSTSAQRTKSAKWRDIPLSPGATEALKIIIRDTEFVFPRIAGSSLSRAFKTSVVNASLGGSLHDLRHTFISHLVMNGIDLRTVQILAGHASFKTTLEYAHLSPKHLRDSVSNLAL